MVHSLNFPKELSTEVNGSTEIYVSWTRADCTLQQHPRNFQKTSIVAQTVLTYSEVG